VSSFTQIFSLAE